MQKVIGRDLEIIREEWESKKAIELFEKMGEKFKVEIIRDLNVPTVSFSTALRPLVLGNITVLIASGRKRKIFPTICARE